MVRSVGGSGLCAGNRRAARKGRWGFCVVHSSTWSGGVVGRARQAHPAVGLIELVDDESLDPLSCVVVSEAGEVRAGIAQQIYYRYYHGQTRDARFAPFVKMNGLLEQMALRVIRASTL